MRWWKPVRMTRSRPMPPASTRPSSDPARGPAGNKLFRRYLECRSEAAGRRGARRSARLRTTLDLNLQSPRRNRRRTSARRRRRAPRRSGRRRWLRWRPMAPFSPWSADATMPRASSIARPRPSGSPARCSSCLSTSRPPEGLHPAETSWSTSRFRSATGSRKTTAAAFSGPVTLRSAFARSINSVAVQLADDVGIKAVIDGAKRLGVQSELPAVPSLALGSVEVTLLEMTRAFAAIAANAESLEPYAVRTIRRGEQELYSRSAAPPRPPTHAAARRAMLELLSSVVNEGTGTRGPGFGPGVGKTGRPRNTATPGSSDSPATDGRSLGRQRRQQTDQGRNRRQSAGSIWREFVTQSIPARAKVARVQPQMMALTTSEGANAKPALGAATIRGVPAVQEHRNTRGSGTRGSLVRSGRRPRPRRARFQALSRTARGRLRAGRQRQRAPMPCG